MASQYGSSRQPVSTSSGGSNQHSTMTNSIGGYGRNPVQMNPPVSSAPASASQAQGITDTGEIQIRQQLEQLKNFRLNLQEFQKNLKATPNRAVSTDMLGDLIEGITVSANKTETIIDSLSNSTAGMVTLIKHLYEEMKKVKDRQSKMEESLTNLEMPLPAVPRFPSGPPPTSMAPSQPMGPPMPDMSQMPPSVNQMPPSMNQMPPSMGGGPLLGMPPPDRQPLQSGPPMGGPSFSTDQFQSLPVPGPDGERPTLMVGRDGWAVDPFDFAFPVEQGFMWEVCPIPPGLMSNPPQWRDWPMVRLFSIEQGILMYKYLMVGIVRSAKKVLDLRPCPETALFFKYKTVKDFKKVRDVFYELYPGICRSILSFRFAHDNRPLMALEKIHQELNMGGYNLLYCDIQGVEGSNYQKQDLGNKIEGWIREKDLIGPIIAEMASKCAEDVITVMRNGTMMGMDMGPQNKANYVVLMEDVEQMRTVWTVTRENVRAAAARYEQSLWSKGEKERNAIIRDINTAEKVDFQDGAEDFDSGIYNGPAGPLPGPDWIAPAAPTFNGDGRKRFRPSSPAGSDSSGYKKRDSRSGPHPGEARKCYSCNTFGHLARDCPSERSSKR